MTKPRTLAATLALAALKTALRIAITAALWPAVTGHAATPDVASLLQAADRYRQGMGQGSAPGTGGGGANLQVETLVTTVNRDGSVDKERRYTVFVQADHRSLVLMRSPAEAGQKVLMLGDDFWLLLPGSARALRITAMQKLLGDASTGDIATLRWADDYSGTVVGEDTCVNGRPVAAGAAGSASPPGPLGPLGPLATPDTTSGQACLHLSLQANRKGLSYQRIELWLGKARHEPLAADLYLQSDKLAKQARFVFDKPTAPTTVTEMVLLDQLGKHQETRVRYLSRQPRTLPESWLNPMSLARNPGLE